MIHPVSTQPTQTISIHSFAEVIENTVTKQRSLHALRTFRINDHVCRFSAEDIFESPNYLTIQTAHNRHITLNPSFLQYCNHSCSPNIFFDTTTMEIIALKNIDINEELCFFYPSTELEMAQPFLCYCGSRDCLKNIKGAGYIAVDVLNKYRLTGFIKEQLKLSF